MCFGRKVDTNGQIKSKGTHRFSAICKLDECTVNIVFGPKCLKVCKLLSGLCRLCRRRWTVFQVALQRRREESPVKASPASLPPLRHRMAVKPCD